MRLIGEQAIADKFISVQGTPVDIGGYYMVNEAKTAGVRRPSTTFTKALGKL